MDDLEDDLEVEAKTEGRGSDRNRIRVLLIDDDGSSRRKLGAALAAGFDTVEVEEISDHVGFFRAIKEPDFDLAITAQDLHWSSGLEVLTAVKSLRPGIPVIMISDVEDEALAAAAMEEGLDAYVAGAAEHATRFTSAVRSALQLIDYEDRVVSLEERLQVLLDRLNVGVFRSTAEGVLEEANPAFLRLLGVDTLEQANKVGLGVFYSDRSELMKRLMEGGHVRDSKVPMTRPDGATAWVALTQTLDTTEDGAHFIDGIAEDVTLARRGEEALQQANDHYRTIFEVTNAATAIIDADDTVSMVNSAFVELSGYSREEIEERMVWTEFIARDDVERIRKQHKRRLEDGASEPETSRFDFVDREGRILHVASTEAILPGSERTVVSLLNVTERQRVEEQLLHDAFHDPVTGLPNRDALLEHLEEKLGKGDAGIALLALDLDRFRTIRDGVGHRAAQLLLQALTKRLQKILGSSSFLASLGGDGFAVLLHPVYAPDQAEVVAVGLLEEMQNPFLVDGHRLYPSMSIGATVVEGGVEPEAVVREAEAAAHRAKKLGGGCWVLFDPELGERAERAMMVENDLRGAFRDGELRVYYQPIASLREGKIIGLEALMRWQRREDEVVASAQFIDVAEASGLIVPMGKWVLETACRQMQTWNEDGTAPEELFLSVNLSRLQLQQPDIVETVARVLRQTDLEASRLMLDVQMRDLGETGVLETFEGFAALGVQLCVEEFGGSVVLLGEMSARGVSTLKIDRSVLAGLGEDGDRWSSVETISRLAHELDLRVIAEGIEASEQLKRLLEMHCDLGQGHLFSMPVEAAAAAELLKVDLMW